VSGKATVTLLGRELRNPLARVIVGTVAIVLGFLNALLLLITLPLTVPLNMLLKRLGRRGFARSDGGGLTYSLGPRAFTRAERRDPDPWDDVVDDDR
jgi:hypothetical protein